MTMRLVAYTLMVLLVVGGLLIVSSGLSNRPTGSAPAETAPVSPTVRTQGAPAAANSQAPVQIVNQTGVQTVRNTRTRRPTNQRLPEDLQAADVAEISGPADQQVLVFRDGSRMPVTPAVRELLPGSVQLKLSYTRDD